MLLFQFEGIAEQWLSADGFRNLCNLRDLFAHPQTDEVAERLSDPAALTASLNFYRANVPPASWVRPPSAPPPPVSAPVMGIWSDGERFLTEESMTGSAAFVAGSWRYERLDGAGHWMQLDRPDVLNDLLLDFLAQAGDIRSFASP